MSVAAEAKRRMSFPLPAIAAPAENEASTAPHAPDTTR
jgi:hypothetical protein